MMGLVLAELLKRFHPGSSMTNGVKNWPDNCDPRSANGGPCFCAEGFFNAYPGPYAFRVCVAGAAPPNDIFNGSWFVEWVRRGEPFDSCQYEAAVPGGGTIRINKFYEDGSAPDGATVAYDVGFDNPLAVPPQFDGYGVRLAEPLPADELPPGTPGGDPIGWPVPVRVIPQAWDAEDPEVDPCTQPP